MPDDNNEQVFEAVSLSFQSSKALEAAAAAEAMTALTTDEDLKGRAISLLRKRLELINGDTETPRFLIDSVFHALSSSGTNGTYTLMKRITLLQQSPFLSLFSCEDLRTIAAKSRILTLGPGRSLSLSRNKCIAFILHGSLRTSRGSVYSQYEVAGEDFFYSRQLSEISSETGAGILLIPISVIKGILDNNGALCLEMLRRRSQFLLECEKRNEPPALMPGIILPEAGSATKEPAA